MNMVQYFFQKRPGVFYVCTFLFGVALFGPDWPISRLGLEGILRDYRTNIGLCFLLFLILALCHLAGCVKPCVMPFVIRNRERRKLLDFIPYMAKKDKEIIGYLLHNRRKLFSTWSDGGYASELIAKGFIRPMHQYGQSVRRNREPFGIPDHLWAVLERHHEKFPEEFPAPDKDSPAPDKDSPAPPWELPWRAG